MLGDSSDKKSEPGARILCLAGWRGIFAGLVFAGITACLAAFTNLPVRQAALPIEVLGDDGTTVSCTVALQVEQAESAHSLWLRTNGLRYPNQGSIQINAGPWIPLNNDTVSVAEPGSSYGAIGGGFATLGMTVPLPKDSIIAGSNTLLFRFNHTDGVSSGYRVLAWNFLTKEGKKIIPPDQFAEDSPRSWVPPLADSASIQAGRELWHTATLRQSNQPNSPKIQAHCSDCHTQDGRDLKYFNFSNNSIVIRSRFHGLTSTQGEQIASYIRSLPFPNPGRPWDPPYQPGPGLDELPVANWAAGAGLASVLDQDVDALPYLFSRHRPGHANSPISAADLRALVKEITPELFRPDGNLSAREIPIALQLPDWNQWLPHIHPKDAWGPAFTQSEFDRLYEGGTYPEADSKGEPPLRRLLTATQTKGSNLRPVAKAFDQWLRARRSFLKRFVKSDTGWSPELTGKVYSTQLWQLVKTWEMTQEFSLEARGRDLYGPGADSHTWFNTIPAETAPLVTHIPDSTAGVGGSAVTNEYFTASWYELQILLNSGNHRHRDRSPVDWVYYIGQFLDLYARTHRPEPTRLLVAVTKALQSTDSRLSPEDFRQGWQPDQNVDPRIMISPAWTSVFKPVPSEVRRAVTEAMLTAWIDKNRQYSMAKYLPLGSPPQTYSPRTYGNITGGAVWEAARQFQDAGMPPHLIDRLLEWGSAYTDRAARLQYEGRTPSGKM